MTRKYLWLRENLNRYTYNTPKANELFAEFSAIVITDKNNLSVDTVAKLEDCYNRFIKMFNDNPFVYRNCLVERAIETDDFDCYFVEIGETYVPVELLKVDRPVESVILLTQKLGKQKEEAVTRKDNLISKFERDATHVREKYQPFKKAKKPSFIRGGLASLASLVIVWYFLVFLFKTDVIEIICSIGDMEDFTFAVTQGMSNMPFMSGTGVWGWFLVLIAHIGLLYMVIKNVFAVKREFQRAYHNRITARYANATNNTIERILKEFDQSFEHDSEQLLATIRKGDKLKISKAPIGNMIKNTKNNFVVAKEFLKLPVDSLRGIAKNSTIVWLVVLALVCHYAYSVMDSSVIDGKIHELNVKLDTLRLRGMKLAVLNGDTDVFKSYTNDSPVKCTLPSGTVVEIKETYEDDDQVWYKIKLITEDEVIKGWIPKESADIKRDLTSEEYTEHKAPNVEASSYLETSRKSYPPESVSDWDRETSWQDGDQDSSGEGEYVVLHYGEDIVVDAIAVLPGNGYSESLYYDNERPRKVVFEFAGGEKFEFEFEDNYNTGLQVIYLNKPVETDYVHMLIKDVYYGNEYEDLCISEFHVFERK